MNMGTMLDLINNRMSFNSFSTMLMSNYIAFAHILGGALLILGVLTRFACLIQIPILIGALMFVSSDLYKPFSALILPIFVLLLLILFLVVGNGKLQLLKFREADQTNSI